MFFLLFDQMVIGSSALEVSDPPMGCAEGIFLPNESFSLFRARVEPQPDGDPEVRRWTGLSIRTKDGTQVECIDAVLFEYQLGDYSELCVDVLGIPYPIYEELFPGRFASYRASFAADEN
jgi:hypothetical protein